MITSADDTATAGDGVAARERRCDAYIISGDDALLLELGPAIGDRFRTRPIEQMEELPGRDAAPWIGFIDGNRPDARHWALHIEKELPDAALIVITSQSDVASWQGLVFRGTVCAALSTSQIDTAALQDALTRAQERVRRAATQAALKADARTTAAPSAGAGTIDGQPGAKPAWLWPAVGAAVLVLSYAGWRWMHGSSSAGAAAPAAAHASSSATTRPSATPPAGAATADAAPAPVRPVIELLSGARSAFRDPERQLPRADARGRGDSALELYAQVLAQEPSNAEARDGLRRLYSVGRSRLQSDIAASRMDDAQRLLAIFRAASSDPATLKAMEADVSAALPRWLQSQVRRALAANDLVAAEQAYAQLQAMGADRAVLQDLRRSLDARATDAQLQALADELHAAIAAGNLIEPAANNARARLQSMRQANRSHPLTATAQHDLQEAMLMRAREAQSAGQNDAVQRWVNAAAELGPSNELTEFRRQLQAESERAATRAPATPTPAGAPAAGASTASASPTAIAAAASAPAAPRYLAARPLRPLSVAYPEIAARSGQQGYVVVEFAIGRDGRAADTTVVESTPAGVFDRAATEAVSRGRFDASTLNDPTAPRRFRLRVTFKPS